MGREEHKKSKEWAGARISWKVSGPILALREGEGAQE